MNDEIVELETKMAFQEDMIHALNLTVAEQQRKLVELERDVKEMQTQLRAIATNLPNSIIDEPPPHY